MTAVQATGGSVNLQANPVVIAIEAAWCFDEKSKGKSYRVIASEFAKKFGHSISHETVRIRIQSEIDARVEPALENYIFQREAVFEAQLLRWHERLDAELARPVKDQSLSWLTQCEKGIDRANEQLGRLRGTYATEKIELTHRAALEAPVVSVLERLKANKQLAIESGVSEKQTDGDSADTIDAEVVEDAVDDAGPAVPGDDPRPE